MTVSAVADEETTDIARVMADLGAAAKDAVASLAQASPEAKAAALTEAAAALRRDTRTILDANAADLAAARDQGLSAAVLDRVKLNEDRIEGMAAGLEAIAELPDPVGAVMAEWTRPNGLKIARVRTPLGVIGIIYEARPNVTADAGGLCLKSGNAAILRGGSEAVRSNRAIHACLQEGLKAAGLPETAIQLVPTQDRDAVGHMLGMAGTIDVIVPRGGKSLVERVQNESRVPVFAHLEGICHSYVDKSADLDKARRIVLNAKMRRPGICGATETLLIDKGALNTHLKPIVEDLLSAGCELRGDSTCRAADERILAANDTDWDTEYLAPVLTVAAVDGVTGALSHIDRHSSGHTEAIIAEDADTANQFLTEIDSAIVMHNASTQFADGGEFGMGGEIGISTGKMHARGPVGVEQLTSFKYIVRGDGQARP